MAKLRRTYLSGQLAKQCIHQLGPLSASGLWLVCSGNSKEAERCRCGYLIVGVGRDAADCPGDHRLPPKLEVRRRPRCCCRCCCRCYWYWYCYHHDAVCPPPLVAQWGFSVPARIVIVQLPIPAGHQHQQQLQHHHTLSNAINPNNIKHPPRESSTRGVCVCCCLASRPLFFSRPLPLSRQPLLPSIPPQPPWQTSSSPPS